MITLHSPSKINLTLDILGKDERVGMHFLNSIFYLHRELQDIITMEKTEGESTVLCSDPRIPRDKSNTILQALEIIGEKGWKVSLEKNIPPQGGLAGGSGNAGVILKYFGQQRGIPELELERMAQQIGADVPVFLSDDNLIYCEGFGDRIVQSWTIDPLPIELVPTGINVSTPKAFSRLDLGTCGQGSAKTEALLQLLQKSSRITQKDLKALVHNDFEVSFFAAHPEWSGKGNLCGSGGTLWRLTDTDRG